MPVNPKWMCGCIPPTPLYVEGEDTGLCEACTFVWDERLYGMRLRQHWSDPDNPIPEGAEDLDDILKAISEEYRQATQST